MNKKEVLQVIRNPKSLSEAKLKEVEKIASDYPYFQGAHTLVAIGHEKFHNPEIKKSLTRAALYSTDRKFLKQLLSSLKASAATSGENPENEVKQPQPDFEIDVPVAPKAAKVKTPVLAEVAPAVSAESAIDAAKDITNRKSKFHIEDEERQDAEEKDLSEVLYLSHDELLKEVFQNLEELRKSKSQYLEVERKIEDAEFEDAQAKAVKKANSNHQKAGEHQDGQAVQKTGKSAGKNTPVKASASKKEKSPQGKVESQPAAGVESAKEPSKGKTNGKSDQNEIIDEFIKKNPSIKTQTSNSAKTKTIDLSAGSLKMKDEIVTENLAAIYIKQGRNDKAIEVYQKLIWKYPQKKTYFAAQIQELQK